MHQWHTKLSLLCCGLGLWLIATALAFNHSTVELQNSDFVSGLLLIILGGLSISTKRAWSGWCIAIVGLWLQLAPLFFWAPTPQIYLTDTVVGILAIIFSFWLKKSNNASSQEGESIPRGWSYNPSDWAHRIPTVFLAMLCWFFARYMSIYQLGYIDQMWDPLFGDGTLLVITSKISRSFPVSDAGMGAVAYTLESIMGWQGDHRRWHLMPWLVIAFGILVVPVGIVSTLLIILQPTIVGAWCGWCLCTALFMLLMIVFTAGELIASLQFLNQSRKEGKSLWQTFWKGGTIPTGAAPLPPRGRQPQATAWGVSIPWNLVICALCGVWLLYSTSFFMATKENSLLNNIAGPLTIVFSLLALAEVTRSLRFVNILLGTILLLSPWLVQLDLHTSFAKSNLLFGALIILFTFRKGKVRERYGSYERWIF
jgi:hypothetical protein